MNWNTAFQCCSAAVARHPASCLNHNHTDYWVIKLWIAFSIRQCHYPVMCVQGLQSWCWWNADKNGPFFTLWLRPERQILIWQETKRARQQKTGLKIMWARSSPSVWDIYTQNTVRSLPHTPCYSHTVTFSSYCLYQATNPADCRHATHAHPRSAPHTSRRAGRHTDR